MTTMLLFALLFSFLLCPPLDDDDDDVDENDVVAICEFQNILHRFCCSKTKSTNAFFLLLLLLSSMMMMVLLLLSLLFSTSTTSRCSKVDKMEKLFSTFCIIIVRRVSSRVCFLYAQRTLSIVKTNLGVSRGVVVSLFCDDDDE